MLQSHTTDTDSVKQELLRLQGHSRSRATGVTWVKLEW